MLLGVIADIHHVVTFAGLLDELAHLGRRILKVVVHDHAVIAIGAVQAGHDGVVFAEIAREHQAIHHLRMALV